MKKYMLTAAVMTLSVSLGMPQVIAAAAEPVEEMINIGESEKSEDLPEKAEKSAKASSKKAEESVKVSSDKAGESLEEIEGKEPSQESPKEDEDSSEKSSEEDEDSSEESPEEDEDSSEKSPEEDEDSLEMLPEKADVNHLIIPQKLQVVIDPWEMDGIGQIYSEEYVVKNTGKTPGILTLSDLACETGEGSGVTVMSDALGLHDDENKSIYMEVIFGEDDKIVLSQEGAVYETEIKPGEELHISFSGEVNENAEESWKDGDVGVKATYSWEETEEAPEAVETVDTIENVEATESTEAEKGEEEGKSEDLEDIDEADAEAQLEEKKEPEIIELKEAEQSEFVVNSWETGEDGNICSVEYQIRNTGDAAGTFTLSELVCMPAEQSGIAVQIENEKLHEGEEKSIYMELVPEPEQENGEKFVILPELLPEEPEASEYKAELKPGEELIFRFVGELNGMKPEDLKEGDIAVRADCSWILQEMVSEESEI